MLDYYTIIPSNQETEWWNKFRPICTETAEQVQNKKCQLTCLYLTVKEISSVIIVASEVLTRNKDNHFFHYNLIQRTVP